MGVSINLRVKDHCIETAAKIELNRLMERYFNTDDLEGELDDRIELIRDFLEKSDFPGLRSSDPRLSGERESEVVISRSVGGAIMLQVQ
jgi:hypothetical protein